MNELKRCFRCKSSDIQIDCQPDIGQSFKLNNRVNCFAYCEKCEIQTKEYASDNLGSVGAACEAAIEDWNKEY